MKKWCTIILLGIAVSCNSNSDWLSDIPESKTDISDSIEWIDLQENTLINPSQMLVIDNYIIIANDASSDILIAFDMATGKQVTVLKRGRAENEVLNINQLLNIDGNVGVVDVIGQKLLLIDVKTMQILLNTNIGDFTTLCMDSDLLIGTLASSTSRYGLRKIDSNEYLRTFGDYSEYNVTDDVGWRVFQGHLLPNAGKVAWFGYYSGAIQIVNYNDGNIISSIHLENFDQEDMASKEMSLDRKINFISLTGNQDMILSLYDGKGLNYYMEHRGAKPCGNIICVFDWMGAAKFKIVYKNPIYHISYNKYDDYLYLCILSSQSSEYRIGRIKIDKLI